MVAMERTGHSENQSYETNRDESPEIHQIHEDARLTPVTPSASPASPDPNPGRPSLQDIKDWIYKTTDVSVQEQRLLDMDPERNPHVSPFSESQWQKERRRIARTRDRWMEDVYERRKKCFCASCCRRRYALAVRAKLEQSVGKKRTDGKKGKSIPRRAFDPCGTRFPEHYCPRLISYECFLNQERTDLGAARRDDPGRWAEVQALSPAPTTKAENEIWISELLCLLSTTKARFSDLAADLDRTTSVIRVLAARAFNHGWPVAWDNQTEEVWLRADGVEQDGGRPETILLVERHCEQFLQQRAAMDFMRGMDDIFAGDEAGLKDGSITPHAPRSGGRFFHLKNDKSRKHQY